MVLANSIYYKLEQFFNKYSLPLVQFPRRGPGIVSCWTFGTPRAIDLMEASGQPYKPGPALKKLKYTAISRKFLEKNVHATTLKGNMGCA